MNEIDTPMADEVGPAPVASAGTLLRQAREAAGLQIAALALALKVPVKKLEALEADRFDLLPDTVFTRALAASICRTLKIEPEAVLQGLPASSAPRLNADVPGINAPFHAPGDSRHWPLRAMLAQPAVLLALMLIALIGVVAYVPLPLLEQITSTGAASSVPTLSQPRAPVLSAPGASDLQDSAPAASTVQAPGGETPGQTQVVVPATTSLPVAVAQPAPPPVPPGGLLQLTAHAPSWVEVVDAAGVVQLRKLLNAGDVANVSGAVPLSVVVGSADATDVQVRGKPMDVLRLARDNVARFEVK